MTVDTIDRDPRSTRAYAARLRADCAASPNAAAWSTGEIDATLADIGTRLFVGMALAQSALTAIAVRHKPPRLIAYVRSIDPAGLRRYLPAPAAPPRRPIAGTPPRQATREAPDCQEHSWPHGTGRTSAGSPLCPFCRRIADDAVTTEQAAAVDTGLPYPDPPTRHLGGTPSPPIERQRT